MYPNHVFSFVSFRDILFFSHIDCKYNLSTLLRLDIFLHTYIHIYVSVSLLCDSIPFPFLVLAVRLLFYSSNNKENSIFTIFFFSILCALTRRYTNYTRFLFLHRFIKLTIYDTYFEFFYGQS